MSESSKAEQFMRRAVELSRLGFPAPNPHVGCVIARDGQIVGEGYHDHAGGPHAEVVALEQAGEQARGADVYVTLEPCNHFGRTGPCSLALVEAGVASVAYAVKDPNPRAEGGTKRLRESGIAVYEGILQDEAAEANSVFLRAMAMKRPFVTLKAAITLDGKIANAQGESKWITGPEARRQGHVLRAEMGAVLVGANTVVRDDPLLTARIEGVVNQPVRVVLDPENVVPSTAKLFVGDSQVVHIVNRQEREGQFYLPAAAGQFDLNEVLQLLWDQKITSVLVEGGGLTIGSFLEARLFERVELFVAPKVMGEGISWSGGAQISALDGGQKLSFVSQQMVGDDLWIRLKEAAAR